MIVSCILVRTIALSNEINQQPTMGCVTDNLQINEYSTSFEDQRNHVSVNIYNQQPIEYGMCFELEDITPISNKLNNDSSFDYQQYMKSKQIKYQATAVRYIGEDKTPVARLKDVRFKLIARNCQINSQLCPYINTLIFGSKDIDDYYTSVYGRIGIAPLFAISGMHISLIYELLIYWLSKFRVVITKANIVSIGLLLGYSLLAGSSVAVNRAMMMIIFKRGFKLSTTISFIAAISISLIANPFNILNSGYQLSYLITAVILFVPRTNFSNQLKDGLFLSAVCYLFAMPISYGFNYSFNIFSPLTILIFTPIVTLILMPLAIVVMVVPMQLLININLILYLMVNNLSSFFDKFTIVSGHVSIIMWLIYPQLLYLCYFKGRKYLSLIIGWFIIISFDFNPIPVVTFIDVGQGDGAVIETRKYNIMIDVGNNSREVAKELNYLGISEIDYLLISHAHLDHYGSLESLDQYIEFNTIYELANNQIIASSIGVEHEVDGGWYTILPYYGTNDNDRELIVRFEFNGFSFLFPGDVELESEQYFVDNYCQQLNSDVIKVPHHGSRTSSSDEFLECVSPQAAIISSGKNNMYNLPNQEIVDKYERLGPVYNTQDEGEIQFKIRKSGIKKTSRN